MFWEIGPSQIVAPLVKKNIITRLLFMRILPTYFLPMYPEETACQSTGMNYPSATARTLAGSLKDSSRPSELTELKEQVAVNSNRVRMTAQRLREFLQRVQGNFPMREVSAEKRPERQGTL